LGSADPPFGIIDWFAVDLVDTEDHDRAPLGVGAGARVSGDEQVDRSDSAEDVGGPLEDGTASPSTTGTGKA
jgi:hypothetical protein